MSDEKFETDAPVTTTPQQPAWELPSLDRIQVQAIMAAILFAPRGTTHDPLSRTDDTYTKDLRASVAIAGDLLDRVEQQERHYLENRATNEGEEVAEQQSWITSGSGV